MWMIAGPAKWLSGMMEGFIAKKRGMGRFEKIWPMKKELPTGSNRLAVLFTMTAINSSFWKRRDLADGILQNQTSVGGVHFTIAVDVAQC